MNWRWTIALGVLLTGTFVMAPSRIVLADSPSTEATTRSTIEPTTQPTPRVITLVNDLASDQFSIRQNAQQELEAIGQPVVPQLQAILDGPLDDEARTRIRAAMHRIGDQQKFGASVITIHCKDAPLEKVLQDFAHQAGSDLGINRLEIRDYLNTHKISLNLTRADFWTALQAVEDASGLHARPDNDGRLILDNMMGFWMGQVGDRTLGRIAGPCLIVPQSISWTMQYGHGADDSILRLQIQTLVEPKLRLAGSFQSNWLRECVDDKGHSLISPTMNSGFFSRQGQWLTTLTANLQVVPGLGKKIARLKGELVFDVQTKSETIDIDNILSAQNVVKKLADSEITVQQFRNENGQYQLHLLVSGPLAAPNSQFLQGAVNSKFQILDDKNQQFQQMGSNQSIDGNGHITLTLFYSPSQIWNGPMAQPLGPPKKLRCEITTETRRMSEPFELDDLPLLHAPDEANH